MLRKIRALALLVLCCDNVRCFSLCECHSLVNILRNQCNNRRDPSLKVSSIADSNAEPSSTRRADASAKTTTQTLYDILEASPTDSRAELKKKYVNLAKKWHPDAIRDGDAVGARDFSEIASAWSILSNEKTRLSYDRSLKAERLKEDIAKYVEQRAMPVTELSVRALEKVALPLLRRGAATTLASVQAVFQNGGNLGKAFSAARRAGKAIDKMELQEKADELEEQALMEYNKALDLQQRLRTVTLQRLRLSLHTAGSGLTANEASLLFEGFVNQTASFPPSFWERTNFLKQNIEHEIGRLRDTENKFLEQQIIDSQAQTCFQKAVRERLMAQTALVDAEQKEVAARLAYEQAMQYVKDRKEALQRIERDLTYTEAEAQKSSYDAEILSSQVKRQAEAVRSALVRKESVVYKQKKHSKHHPELDMHRASMSPDSLLTEPISNQIMAEMPMSEPSSDEDNQMRLDELATLKLEERALTDAVEKMEIQAATFLSRANKLKRQVKAMDRIS